MSLLAWAGLPGPRWVKLFICAPESVAKEENGPEMSLVLSLAKTTATKLQLVEHGWDDELLSPVLLLPLLYPWSFSLCEYSFQRQKDILYLFGNRLKVGVGCRSRDLVLLLLPPAIICAPLMLSAVESCFLELSGGGGEDEGKRDPAQEDLCSNLSHFCPWKM